MKQCEWCGHALPQGSHWRRQYHPDCAYQVVLARLRYRYRNDPEYREKELARQRNRYRNDPDFRRRKLAADRERRLAAYPVGHPGEFDLLDAWQSGAILPTTTNS